MESELIHTFITFTSFSKKYKFQDLHNLQKNRLKHIELYEPTTHEINFKYIKQILNQKLKDEDNIGIPKTFIPLLS